MVAVGFGVFWVGYLQAVYGYCLLKGYDVRWSELANPVHPYQWPVAGETIPTVPKGQILPTSGKAKANQRATTTAASATA